MLWRHLSVCGSDIVGLFSREAEIERVSVDEG